MFPVTVRCLLAALCVARSATASAPVASCNEGNVPAVECALNADTETLAAGGHLKLLQVSKGGSQATVSDGDWVPLGHVDPNVVLFTQHVRALCAKRRRISIGELAHVRAALEGGQTPVDKLYSLLGHALLVHAPIEGMHLEFGVATGRSANISGLILGALARERNSSLSPVLDGFDTFEGLPLTWDGHLKRGAFAQPGGHPPPVVSNVHLHKGFFNETLPGFLAARPEAPLSFANIDGDLYESTIEVLRLLRGHLRAGSVLHFHELVHGMDRLNPMEEMRALHDFLIEQEESAPVQLEFLSVVSDFVQPAVFRVA